MSNNEGVFTDTVTTCYDPEGHVVAQRGATYPVDYAYDEFGDKIAMTTYRSGGPGFVPAAGDTTRWLRDEATGLVTNKVYADGKGPRYDYTPEGKLATRIWARGIVTTYSYDANGSLTNTVYSDGTPTISLAYNRAGRQIEAHDAAGVTTFLYDDFGAVTNETVVGVAGTNTIERCYDSFGRSLGYALNGVRQSTLAYDPATGRLASMQVPSEQSNNPNNQTIKQFSWNYLLGSDLKSSLSYPNGLTASWQYNANGQLLQVCNATPTNAISQYDYAYDAAGRRIQIARSGFAMSENRTDVYGYNARGELVFSRGAAEGVENDFAYEYDDIGNRMTSLDLGTNRTYIANNLNQYTSISNSAFSASPREAFIPQFDDDGNQTLVKTATGIWSVTYNGENRPTLWSCIQSNNSNNTNNQTILSMSYDRMGRRVTKNAQRFVYDGYLQVANFEHQTSNIKLQTFIWDPTEPVATRPLVWNSSTSQPFNFSTSYYTHDSNKNVSEVVAANGVITAHYEYAPFGAVLGMHGESASLNPWRFSCEYAEDDSATIYYNYRHYEPVNGRWLSRDPIGETGGLDLYCLLANSVNQRIDKIGLRAVPLSDDNYTVEGCELTVRLRIKIKFEDDAPGNMWSGDYGEKWKTKLKEVVNSYFNEGYWMNDVRGLKIKELNGLKDKRCKSKCCPSCKNGISVRLDFGFDDNKFDYLIRVHSQKRRSEVHAKRLEIVDWQAQFIDEREGDWDYDDIDLLNDVYTPNPLLYDSEVIETKQITALHEIGHMLGLDHPLAGLKPANSDEEYGTTKSQREELMGTGMNFTNSAFDKVFCSRISSVSRDRIIRNYEWSAK